ncbi:MAG: hypothetical protein M3Q92_13475, partial [Actinomycetota bacterium]|nr:hypothetical protein [Actinomycetota bacterium]
MWRLQQELVDSGDTEALLAAVSGQFNEPKAILAKVQEWYDEPEQETLRCSNWLTVVCSFLST